MRSSSFRLNTHFRCYLVRTRVLFVQIGVCDRFSFMSHTVFNFNKFIRPGLAVNGDLKAINKIQKDKSVRAMFKNKFTSFDWGLWRRHDSRRCRRCLPMLPSSPRRWLSSFFLHFSKYSTFDRHRKGKCQCDRIFNLEHPSDASLIKECVRFSFFLSLSVIHVLPTSVKLTTIPCIHVVLHSYCCSRKWGGNQS